MISTDQQFSAPVGAEGSGLLTIAGGAAGLTVVGAELPHELCRADLRELRPDVDIADGMVGLRYRRRPHPFARSRGSGRILISDAVEWAVAITGGASEVMADLSGVGVRRVSIADGAADVTVALPVPVGVVRVRFLGSVNRVTIRRPATVQVGLFVDGGGTGLQIDGRRLTSVGHNFVLRSDAANRYEVDVTGGASELSVEPA